jgi:hypothetical protein
MENTLKTNSDYNKLKHENEILKLQIEKKDMALYKILKVCEAEYKRKGIKYTW